MTFDVHQAVTDRIIAALKNGASETWTCPWNRAGGALPRNAATGKAYRGINVLSLWVGAQAAGYTDDRWATYKQCAEMGAQVRKGEMLTTAGGTVLLLDALARVRAASPERADAREAILSAAWAGLPGWRG